MRQKCRLATRSPFIDRYANVALRLCAVSLFIGPAASAQAPSTVAVGQVAVPPADLIRRAFDGNRELAAVRLDFERGRARLQQAGLRPNPTIDIEHATGRFTRSPDERALSIGVALPIELGARRQRRMDVATAELAVIEADIANRERELTRDVLIAYVDASAAVRELELTERLYDLNQDMVRVVRTRVDEQDAPPLELNLLLTEVARLRSRGALLQGRVDAARITIGQLVGAPGQPPAVESSSGAIDALTRPATLEEAIATALERRSDVAMAKRNEEAAEAGLRLARAEAWPDATLSTTYTVTRGLSELPHPLVAVRDDDQVLAFGASIGLPFLNKNQGARAEAAAAITQARFRREATEQIVRAEVSGAFRRLDAARRALTLFEQGVVDRSNDNIGVIRAAYELGEFRIMDVLNEQRRLLEVQHDYLDALAGQNRAIVDLRAAVGLIGVQP